MKIQSAIIDTVIKFTDTPRKRQITTFIAILFVAVVVTIGPLAGYLYFIKSDKTSDTTQQLTVAETALDGSIFATFVGQNAANTIFAPVEIEAATSTVTEIPVTELNGNPAETFGYHLSENLEYITFLGAIQAATSSDATSSEFAVYRANTQNRIGEQRMIDILQAAEKITQNDNTDAVKRSLSIANNGNVIYSALSKTQAESADDAVHELPAEDWTIYTVNNYGIKTEVTNGLNPTWITENRFAFMKNDGVYLYNLNSNTEELLWPTGDQTMNLSNDFDVSPNGDRLVVTNPRNAEVAIVELPDNGTRQFSPATVISVTASNPVFSPDGTRIAMVVTRPVNGSGANTETETRVEYFSLATEMFEDASVLLDMSNLSGVHLTDWNDSY